MIKILVLVTYLYLFINVTYCGLMNFTVSPSVVDYTKYYEIVSIEIKIDIQEYCLGDQICERDFLIYLGWTGAEPIPMEKKVAKQLNATSFLFSMMPSMNIYNGDVGFSFNITDPTTAPMAIFTTSDIDTLGFQPYLQIIQPPEPTIRSLFLNPNANTFESSPSVNIVINSDYLLLGAIVQLDGPLFISFSSLGIDSLSPSPRGTYNMTLTTPYDYLLPGLYTVSKVSLPYRGGRTKIFGTQDLQNLGLNYEFNISSLPEPSYINITIKSYELSPNKTVIAPYFQSFTAMIDLEFDCNSPMFSASLGIDDDSGPNWEVGLKKSVSIHDIVDFKQIYTLGYHNVTLFIKSPYISAIKSIVLGQIEVTNDYSYDVIQPTILNITFDSNLTVTAWVHDNESGVQYVMLNNKIFNTERSEGTIYLGKYVFYLDKQQLFTNMMLTAIDYAGNQAFSPVSPPIFNPPTSYYQYNLYHLDSYKPTLNISRPGNIDIIMTPDNSLCTDRKIYGGLIYTNIVVRRNINLPFELDSTKHIINGTACNPILGTNMAYITSQASMFALYSFYENLNYPAYYFMSITNPTVPFNFIYFPMIKSVNLKSTTIVAPDAQVIEIEFESQNIILTVEIDLYKDKMKKFGTPNLFLTLVQGTNFNGKWRLELPIPEFSKNGTYVISVVKVQTASVLYNFDKDSLVARGLPNNFQVQSNSDIIRPTLSNFTYVNGTQDYALISASDSQSGIKMVKLVMTPFNITKKWDFTTSSTYRECIYTLTPQDNKLNGVYKCLYQDVLNDGWYYNTTYFFHLFIYDNNDNVRYLTPDQLQSSGFQSSVEMNSTKGGDYEPPFPVSVEFIPPIINNVSTEILIRIRVTDNLSGTKYIKATLTYQMVHFQVNFFSISYGDKLDGVFEQYVNLDPGMDNGVYNMELTIDALEDWAGNVLTPIPYYMPYTGLNYTLLVNITGNTNPPDTNPPKLTYLTIPSTLIDLADITPSQQELDMTILVGLQDNETEIVHVPIVELQHKTDRNVPLIECDPPTGILLSRNGQYKQLKSIPKDIMYFCLFNGSTSVGEYFLHVRTFGDYNNNFASCFKCATLSIVNYTSPLIEYSNTVPTRGGIAIFGVSSFRNNSNLVSLFIKQTKCSDLKINPNNTLSCTIPSGTGYIPIQGYSNGYKSNLFQLQYTQPSIYQVSSVPPGGGEVTLIGDNFGTNTNVISIQIGSMACNPTFTNHTMIRCNLGSSPSGGIHLDVFLTVDGLVSSAIGSFSYGDPPSAKCPLGIQGIECSGNGGCVNGVCNCYSDWSGDSCSQSTVPIVPVQNDTAPVIIIHPNGTSTSINTTLGISLYSFNEISLMGDTVHESIFTNWTLTTVVDTSTQDNQTIYIYNTTLHDSPNTNIIVNLTFFATPTNISFANNNDTAPSYSMKYTIDIFNYNWRNRLNTGRLVFVASLQSFGYTVDECMDNVDTQYGGVYGKSNDIRWLKVSQGNYTLFGKFSNRAIIDNRIVIVSNELLTTSASIIYNGQRMITSLVGINVPSFYQKCRIDPIFSVLLNTDGDKKIDNGKCGGEKESNKTKIIAIAVVIPIVCIAIAFAAFVTIKKQLKRKRETKKMESKLNRFK